MPQATLALTQALLEPPGELPPGHLELINALQSQKGKKPLVETDLIARPIRLTGNDLTCYYTKFPDDELASFAQQAKDAGAPLLSAHITDDRPIGTYYTGEVTSANGFLWLDTYAYWLVDDKGLELARDIDAGIINEASIGFSYKEAKCSICGEDWLTSWDCPHWPGRTYPVVVNEGSQETEERLCFLWLIGCTFDEGSIVYRGGHPGTRVGGTLKHESVPLLGANGMPGQGAPQLTSFQLQATRDMASLYAKKAKPPGKPVQGLGKPPKGDGPTPEPTPQADGPEGEEMKLKLKKKDGLTVEVETAEEAQALLDEGYTVGQTDGEQRLRETVAGALGLEPKDLEGKLLTDHLGVLSEQAKVGEVYRTDLEARLSAAAVTVEGQGAKAERIGRMGKKADLDDLKGLVEDWEAKALAVVPDGQLSQEEKEKEVKAKEPLPVDDV